VTTLDLHDFSRLARTYGLGGVYATTPLPSQRKLAGRLVEHWVSGYGGRVNPCRREALEGLRLKASLGEALEEIAGRWGEEPWVIATSARPGPDRLSFEEARRKLALSRRPSVVAFGTGWGLTTEALEGCDGILEPICGPGEYNHLSVRSAASIVVDRLFGPGAR
jgi:hypothetical protein